MDPLLSVKNLSVSFTLKKQQKLHAVRNVSFDLGSSEMVGIVGESGCGKSALVRALVKLFPTQNVTISGEAHLDGQDLISLSERQLHSVRGKKIGFIFQDPMTSLNPTMKIGTQILENCHYREEVYELLDLVGISRPKERFNEYPHTLSGGMRQRVMIALALAAHPRLIIADEPTTALDVTIQAQILALMHQIKEKTKTSFLLITHDLSVVAGHCDRVMVMYAGRVVEEASVMDLFARPSHPYTQGLLHAIPRLDKPKDSPLIPIEGTPPSLLSLPPGCSFCPRCCHAMPICQNNDPALEEIIPHHQMACFLGRRQT